jgi:hypothetical protein
MDNLQPGGNDTIVESDEEAIPKSHMAMILGLEEVIAELKSINQKLDFNNDNISNFRTELDGLRNESTEAIDDITYVLYDKKGLKNDTISNHLRNIRMMLFWALFGIPMLVGFIVVINL